MIRLQPNLLGDKNGLYRISADDEQFFASTVVTGWSVNNPSTLSVVDDVFRSARRFSLRMTNSTAGSIVAYTMQGDIAQPYASLPLLFNCLVLCEKELTVSAYLHKFGDSYTSVDPNVQTTIPNVWSPVFSNELTPSDSADPAASMSMTVIVTGNSTSPVYLTSPNLTHADPDKFNQFVILSQQYFPDVFREIDEQQENPKRPLMKLYHSLTANASLAMDEYVRIFPFDNDETAPGQLIKTGSPENLLSRSELTDPELMSHEYMHWAAMFIGSRILTDVQVDETSIFMDENFDFAKWQVSTRAFGFAAGNKESIKNAVRTILTGSRSVLVTPLWEGDEWAIMVRTLTSETPGVSVDGDTSEEVLAIANLTKPAGYTIDHFVVDEITFILNDPDFGVFDLSVLG